jgi:hypothetical protein
MYDNIQFKSSLEVYCYQQLKKNHLEANYEVLTIELIPKFTFIGKWLESSKNGLKLNSGNCRPMTYTPDFTGNGWIIECKGYAGADTWQLKSKLIKYHLRDADIGYYLPSNRKQVDETINLILKNNETHN